MSRNIHINILKEYEKRQNNAQSLLERRKNEVYSKIPRIQQIDNDIRREGLKHNKMILSGELGFSNSNHSLITKIAELKTQRIKLLEEYGYPSDYLEINYECTDCKDTGFVDSKTGPIRCSCYRQLLISYLYRHSNLNIFTIETFENFDESLYSDEIDENKYKIKISPRENINRIKTICLDFVENFNSPDTKNLFFSGPTGVGKTYMCNCVCAKLLEKGSTVLYQTAPMLFNTINEYKMKAFNNPNFQDSNYKNIFDVELLVIDDLGTESLSASRYAELLTILNTRQMNNMKRPCKTIISTNIGIRQLHEYYDERIASRVIGSFLLLRFCGDDIRAIKKIRETQG